MRARVISDAHLKLKLHTKWKAQNVTVNKYAYYWNILAKIECYVDFVVRSLIL